MRRLAVAALGLALVSAGCATGQTGDPASVSDRGAAIDGTVISDTGGEVEFWVEYGPTRAYGLEGPHGTVQTEPNAPAPARAGIDDLSRSTVYHYRLCAQDSQQQGGPGCGEDRHFKTQSFACGDTVTADIRLTGDVSCLDVATPGIRIGADGVDVDLNGHQLIGPVFVGGGIAPAIDDSGGFDDLTIHDGSIGNFGDGIHVEGADRTKVLHVSSFGPQDGIDIRGGQGHEIRHSAGSGRNGGIIVANATGVVVADSTASGNFGSGMTLSSVSDSRAVRNTVTGPGAGCCVTFGLVLSGNGNVVEDNKVSGFNGGNLVLQAGANNKLISNELFDGFISPFPDPPAEAGDGLYVGAFTAGTVIRDNYAHDNEGDGIEVAASSARLTDNRADANGDFGIDAAAGVTDGGGNTASGNGNSLQCRNVVCEASPP
jgi:Right handed beta helix region